MFLTENLSLTTLTPFQPRLYKSIIEEVIDNVRDKFLDEGIDEQVLIEVKQAWEQKVAATRATDHNDKHQGTSQQQQLQQTAHQQVASGLTGQPGQGMFFIF